MKVLLATCSVEEGSRERAVQLNSHYPVGLASVHASLEKAGHEVFTLFLNDFPEDACMGILRKHVPDYDVLGLQILSHNRVISYRVMEEFQGKIRIVIGGIHASIMYEQIIRRFPKVVAVIGEGEVTFPQLLEGGPLADIPGIAYMTMEEVYKTPDRPLITDLDALPFPKHEAFWNDKRTTASILTSRGCPFKCSFCSLDVISRRKVRYRSVDGVMAEIRHLKRAFPALNSLWIHDDSFLLDEKRAISLCNAMRDARLGLKIVCSARFKPFSEELVAAMEAAGVVWVLFGLESGCQRVLDRNHKGLKLLDATKTMQLLRFSRIQTTCFLIVGLPGEDDDSVADTCDFVNHLQRIKPLHYDDIGVAMVYPGTELFDLMKQAGKMDDDFWMTDAPVPFYTAENDIATLNRMKETILARIRPQ